jgi:hypothetical protein
VAGHGPGARRSAEAVLLRGGGVAVVDLEDVAGALSVAARGPADLPLPKTSSALVGILVGGARDRGLGRSE